MSSAKNKATRPIQAWKRALQTRGFALRAGLTAAALVVTMILYGRFITAIEARPGVMLPDPVLALIHAHDVTVLTFVLIYSTLLAAVVYLAGDPERFVLGAMAYTIMVSLRMMMMYSVPLEPPANIIPLVDPLVEALTVPKTFLKDLFFSGHTSTAFLLYLLVKNRTLKLIFLVSTVMIAGCVLVQHVHYFLDVAAAPFFAYGAYRFATAIQAELA